MADSSLRDIKRRIESISSINHITKAMSMVSSAKLKRAKTKLDNTKAHFEIVTESIEEIFHGPGQVESRYLEGSREIKKRAYMIISSHRGLCGGFNTSVIKEALSTIAAQEKDSVGIIAIGLKGLHYFQMRGYDIISEYMGPPENISFLDAKTLGEPIIAMYDEGKIDELYLIYTSYVSSFEQITVTEKLLPFEPRGKAQDYLKEDRYVEYQPSEAEVFDYLVPKYVEIMIYKAIAESVVCEHATRRMSMEHATENAREIIDDLSLTYNRARQGAITQELSEIIGGAEALR